MNASIPPSSGELTSLLALLKDDKKAQDFLDKSEKTKSEIAQNIKENEIKLKAIEDLSASIMLERERLFLVKKQAEEAVAAAHSIDKDLLVKSAKASEALAKAEEIVSLAKETSEEMLKSAKAREVEAEDLRSKAKKEYESALALKASLEEKMKKLKNLIGEA